MVHFTQKKKSPRTTHFSNHFNQNYALKIHFKEYYAYSTIHEYCKATSDKPLASYTVTSMDFTYFTNF